MESKIIFSERQKFKQWWLWLLLIGINGLFLLGLYQQIINRQQSDNTEILVPTALSISLSLLFMVFRLDTIIRKDGIYVRFFPLHLKFKHYAWDSLTKSYVRQYSALGEYGGWGLRLGFFGSGKAYNISGNKGLQLVFTNNKKLLIGTNKPDELARTIEEVGQLKS